MFCCPNCKQSKHMVLERGSERQVEYYYSIDTKRYYELIKGEPVKQIFERRDADETTAGVCLQCGAKQDIELWYNTYDRLKGNEDICHCGGEYNVIKINPDRSYAQTCDKCGHAKPQGA